jgi:hypothetical protein
LSEPKFVILEYEDDMILQIRAVQALKDMRMLQKEGDVAGIEYEDGRSYGVKRNKNSVRVYRQPMPSVQAPEEGN